MTCINVSKCEYDHLEIGSRISRAKTGAAAFAQANAFVKLANGNLATSDFFEITFDDDSCAIAFDIGTKFIADQKNPTRADIVVKLPALGRLGELLASVDREYRSMIGAYQATHSDDLKGILSKSYETYSPVSYEHSDATKDPALRGKKRDVPLVHIKLDFASYSDSHPIGSLRGQPKTTINTTEGATEVIINGRKYYKYKPLMCPNGDAINVYNVQDAIKSGDIIKKLRVAIDSISFSKQGISMRIIANQICIKSAPRGVSNLDGEVSDADIAAACASASASTSADAAPAAAGAAASASAAASTQVPASPSDVFVEDDDEPLA